MAIDTSITVRHPYVGEVPSALITGLEVWKIDPEWQWVAVVEGRVVAQLLACNAHGLFMMLRLTALPDAPKGIMLSLLRGALREAKERNMIGYLTFLGDDTEPQTKLMRIVLRHGGYLEPVTGAWAAGRLEV